jgi:predicted kinase
MNSPLDAAIETANTRATLYFMCGKMAAGKTTLSKALAHQHDAVLLNQDDWLVALYPGEILNISDYVRCSMRLRAALTRLIVDLLTRGTSVVLDHPGNTRKQRQWFRDLIERANVPHELHFVDASDDTCKQQLKQRSAALPAGAAWTTDAEFDAITAYFQAPETDENFNVIRHERV